MNYCLGSHKKAPKIFKGFKLAITQSLNHAKKFYTKKSRAFTKLFIANMCAKKQNRTKVD